MASIEVFCCYAHKDAPLLADLKAHLTLLQRQGLIALWTDTNISPGSNWEQEIEKHLNTAHIILLLVSSDFMSSEYCYSKEMLRAIERHHLNEAIVIPIILRPVYWQGAPFAKLQVLPTNAKPVVSPSWHSQDEAMLDVVNGIGAAIKFFQTNSSVRNSQLKEYISLEIRKGRPISEVLMKYDPSLNILFQTIIEAANNYISEVSSKGQPTRKALKYCSPGLEHLFEVTIAKDVSEDHILAVQGRIEKLLTEISAVGDGDLRVHAEVTLDTIGVLADSFNYLIEELAAVIIRVQMTTSAVTEGTDVLVNAIHAQERVIETITNITQHESSSPSEKMKYIGITNETQRLEKVMKSMMSQTEQMRKIVDALYVSVSGFLLPDISSFRLPQNTPASWSPLFDLNKKS